MVRLKLSLGKNQQIRPKDIVGAIAGECDISGNSIGRIDLYSNYSFVEVPIDYASTVLDIMNQKDIRGHDVEFQVATPKPRDDDRHRGSMRNHNSYRSRTITRSSTNSRFNHRVGRRQYRFGM
ncbi:MAG TPA: DbpA RNA binding domain-containing protein [Methanocorpusculum sp.]|nr:DbpA RNA binding domain-containing protein [Methanocorpusculum sp.]